MLRAVHLVRAETGETIERVRVQDFGPSYFVLLRRWRAAYPESAYLIRFRPCVKLHIDFTRYPIPEGTMHHG